MYMPIAHRVKNKFYSLKEDFSLRPINQKCIPCDYIISVYDMTLYIQLINTNVITIFKGRVAQGLTYRLWYKVLKIQYLRISPIILDSFMMHYHGVCCIYHWLLLFYILLSIATITSIIINIAHQGVYHCGICFYMFLHVHASFVGSQHAVKRQVFIFLVAVMYRNLEVLSMYNSTVVYIFRCSTV